MDPRPATESRQVLDASDISRVVSRMAHELLENAKGVEHLTLLGIPTRGVPLAQRIAARIRDIDGAEVPVGALDITMFRDDLRSGRPRSLEPTSIPAPGLDDRIVVLVDDVLYSGRTIRAALDALGEFGRPRVVRLAVLVDRGHRELPIRADVVGKNLPTSAQEKVAVRFVETDGVDEVCLERAL